MVLLYSKASLCLDYWSGGHFNKLDARLFLCKILLGWLLARKMKPKVVIAIPEPFSEPHMEKLKSEIFAKFSNIEFEIVASQSTKIPQAKSIDRRGVDMGSFDGDKNYPSLAMISGIQADINRLFLS